MNEPATDGDGLRAITTLSAAARAHGITPRTFAVLACATARPGLSAKDARERLNLEKSAVSYALSNLKRHGLVDIKADPADQRRTNIFPTAAGIALLKRISALAGRAPAPAAPADRAVTHAAADSMLAA